MTNNTKQSEETYIRWSVNMNSAIEVGQLQPEPILTIHPDGRVTTSPRLKPDEISALALDQIKTQWMKDSQATKIRELQERIKRLEEAGDAIKKSRSCGCQNGDSVFYCISCINAWDAWLKAKEAKP